jgi:thioredoxin-like negative regulator of GroEL
LLTSWATWCRDCKELLPALERLHDERGEELHVVAVNVNAGGGEERIETMVDDYGLKMELWRDRDNDFTAAFGAPGVPTSVLVDEDGAVVQRWPGAIDLESDEIVRAVDDALRSPSGG